MKRLLVALTFSVQLLFGLSAGESVASRVELIPKEDRRTLSQFFRRLFSHSDFSYTLLGRKPMGSIDYSLDLIAAPQFYKDPQELLFLMALDKKGWEVWEKYAPLFSLNKYCFIKIQQENFFGFILVNREKALEVISGSLADFQKLVRNKLNAGDILSMICEGRFGYYHSNEICLSTYYKAIGLLYGYGEENVQAFIQRELMFETLKTFPFDLTHLPVDKGACLEMEENTKSCKCCSLNGSILFSSITLDLITLMNQTCLIGTQKKQNPFYPLKKSCFLGYKDHAVTQKIVKSYDELDEEILKINEAENFLEIVLEMLTS